MANLARLDAAFRGVLSRTNENTRGINENTRGINENTQRINENTQRLNELGGDSADALAATQVLAGQLSDLTTTVRRQLEDGDANLKRLTRVVSRVADLESETRNQTDEIDERLTHAETVLAKLKRG